MRNIHGSSIGVTEGDTRNSLDYSSCGLGVVFLRKGDPKPETASSRGPTGHGAFGLNMSYSLNSNYPPS